MLTQPSIGGAVCRVLLLSGLIVILIVSGCGSSSSYGGGGGGGVTYTVGGSVSGLIGSGLVLQDNGGDNLPVSANGPFTFTTALDSGVRYNVSASSQPTNPSQTCVATPNTGTVSSNITVSVICTTDSFTVGGTVSGLAGSGLTL